MRKLLLVLVTLGLFSTSVNSLELDVGVGYTLTKQPANGLWYQEEFDHKLEKNSPSFNIGLRFNPIEKVDLVVGYQHLGSFSSYAKASSSDMNYEEWRRGESEIWPLATWEGSGRVHGIYSKIQYNFKHFFITGGGFYHVSEYKMEITDWRCASRDGRCSKDYPKADYGDPVERTVHSDEEHQWGWSIGVGKEFGPVSISYEVVDILTKGRYPAIYAGEAQNISITYTFK